MRHEYISGIVKMGALVAVRRRSGESTKSKRSGDTTRNERRNTAARFKCKDDQFLTEGVRRRRGPTKGT